MYIVYRFGTMAKTDAVELTRTLPTCIIPTSAVEHGVIENVQLFNS